MPFAAVAVLLLLMATLAALIGHCNNDHKTLIACALYTLAGLDKWDSMLAEEELRRLTGGENYVLETTGGGFQGRHFRLSWPGGSYFLKAEAASGCWVGGWSKEPQVYSRLLPALGRYTAGAQLWPRLVLARRGLLVLEDLGASGWVQEAELGPPHLRAALAALAGLHAASLRLGDSAPLEHHFQEELRETYFGPSPPLRTWAAFTATAAKVYARYFPGRHWEAALCLMTSVPQMVRPSLKYRNCLCHGDPWPNNIFFKCIEGIPYSACLVDFAQVRYCPPATDVLLLLRLLQVEDREAYLRFYHSRLVAQVPSFSLQEFLDSCTAMDRFALCVAPLYVYLTKLPPSVLQCITRTTEDFTDFAMGNDTPALEVMETDQRYRNQVLRAFRELLEFSENLNLETESVQQDDRV